MDREIDDACLELRSPGLTMPRQEYVQVLARQGFDLGQLIGSGAYGSVFKAIQRSLRRAVAVKFFDNPFTKGAANRTRFGREAPLLARVQHPAVPYVLTTGHVPIAASDQIPYMVMEFVGGVSLFSRLEATAPLELDSVFSIMRSLLSALDCAHQNDVVHRDVKPDNILISDNGVFLIDFSIGFTTKPDVGLERATGVGECVGTANYAAPEQLRDSSGVDLRADIYSAGVVLAEMLGARPRIRLHSLDSELRDLPSTLRDVVRRATADDPDDRFARAGDFWTALDSTRLTTSASRESTLPVIDEGQLSDDDATILGVIAAACPMEDDGTSITHIEDRTKSAITRFSMTVAIRRLLRFEKIRKTTLTDWNGNNYDVIRLTDEGAYWAETHHKRVASLLDLLSPRVLRSVRDDDIPF